MGRPPEQAYCRECGEPCPRRGRWDNGWRCVQCAVKSSGRSNRQIMARRGEYYEKWVAGMARALEKERQRVRDNETARKEADPQIP